MDTRLATWTGFDPARVEALAFGMKCKNGKLEKGGMK
jgi:hypothetical protein